MYFLQELFEKRVARLDPNHIKKRSTAQIKAPDWDECNTFLHISNGLLTMLLFCNMVIFTNMDLNGIFMVHPCGHVTELVIAIY